VREAVDRGKLRGVRAVAGEEPERTCRCRGLELPVVADEQNLRAGFRRSPGDAVECEGAGEARLVHDHELTRLEGAAGHDV